MSGISVIEAMTDGVEVVTSQHGALPETIGNGRFGLTYPFTTDFTEHIVTFLWAVDFAIRIYWDSDRVKNRREMSIFSTEAYD